MITIGKDTADRINHFNQLCPFLTTAEQVELRNLGNSYFEQLSGIVNYMVEYTERNPFLEAIFGPLAKEMAHALETYGYVLDGNYYNDDQRTAEKSMEERNFAGDGLYFKMMDILQECKEKKVETEFIVFVSGHNKNKNLEESNNKDNNDSADE